MKVPVVIYADDKLLQKMTTDRTLSQAINGSTIPGIQGNSIVLPDGHEGYGISSRRSGCHGCRRGDD